MVDIFLINQTKLDEFFLNNQFAIFCCKFIRKEVILGVELIFKLLINFQAGSYILETLLISEQTN